MQNPRASSLPSRSPSSRPVYEVAKRIFDVAAASAGFLLLLPFMALIAGAIRLDSPGPIVFRQERLGKDGHPFVMSKFRTMVTDNDDSQHREFMMRHVKGESESRGDSSGGGSGDSVFLLSDDRITVVGRFLRRTSLDELPNLVNVVGGSMSIVGPRPPIPYEAEHYDAHAARRLTVKPGMTGIAQTRGRGSLTFEAMVQYDLEYIDGRSFWMDVKILWGTIPAVLLKRGV